MPGAITFTSKTNAFNDQSPIIPTASRVQTGKVLLRLDLDITVARDNQPVPQVTIAFSATGASSTVTQLAPTDAQGKAVLRLETREFGTNVTITSTNPDFAQSRFDRTFTEAWYESTFLVTAYNCCAEDDFSGPLVEGGAVGRHKQDFLFGGRGVIMQGTGRASDGRFIRITNPRAIRWNPNFAGVANPEAAVFAFANGVQGAFGAVRENHSVAVDPTVVPARNHISVTGLGDRWADDTGGAIRDYHVDNFVGAGQAALRQWHNISAATVKYLGP
ncbi:MAG TPA: 3D domain-containing protein [Bryobacteraceae bacterium]|jgi:3D (Asp-Asp-Asp) domain-containing protein|nr:3D domain-containing protein [Bryobacteraceae bacterium]